jgi:hypothetical protein
LAAKILAGALEDSLKKLNLDKKKDSLLILGIPRGGVVVADIVASKLPYNCEFDIVIPRKLTAPYNQEIAIGAVMKEYDEMTEKEKEDFLMQIRDLPDDDARDEDCDFFDPFTQSFSKISKTWSDSLKEFEALSRVSKRRGNQSSGKI